MKLCKDCKEFKQLEEFSRAPDREQGRFYICKSCAKARRKKNKTVK
jgi:protein-arginine kinase activator protein McsA